jgi:hypothetical protein
MDDRLWNTGSPPHIGWWNASPKERKDVWRWWNGLLWSIPAFEHESASVAGWKSSSIEQCDQSVIKWSDFWPRCGTQKRVTIRQGTEEERKLATSSRVEAIYLENDAEVQFFGEQSFEHGFLIRALVWVSPEQLTDMKLRDNQAKSDQLLLKIREDFRPIRELAQEREKLIKEAQDAATMRAASV